MALKKVNERVLLLDLKPDIPPTSNSYIRHWAGDDGKMQHAKTEIGTAYENKLGWLVKEVSHELLLPKQPRAVFYEEFVFWLPSAVLWTRDTDNMIKLIQDTVFRTLGRGDQWVSGHRAEKLALPEEYEEVEPDGYAEYLLYWTGEIDVPQRKRKAAAKVGA